jgi:hypothetical protein
MSKLADIQRLLLHIRLKLSEHLMDAGMTIDDAEFPSKIEDLNRITQMLAFSIRELKSARHAANAREQNLWNIPRDKRYAPAAAVAGQQREIGNLMREAAETQAVAEKLLGRIYRGSEMEGVHTVAELLEKFTEHDTSVAELSVPNHPAYVPASQAHLHASPEAAVVMAYVALRGLVIGWKRLTDKVRS